jgi:hypothetical protein
MLPRGAVTPVIFLVAVSFVVAFFGLIPALIGVVVVSVPVLGPVIILGLVHPTSILL